jgi:hypothetical protein
MASVGIAPGRWYVTMFQVALDGQELIPRRVSGHRQADRTPATPEQTRKAGYLSTYVLTNADWFHL